MHSFRKRRRGAALVEFAFVGILFFALLFGMLQFGIYLSVTNALWNLSREGARYAAVKPATGVDEPAVYADIVKHIQDTAPPSIRKEKMTITITPDSAARRKGQPITVTISYDMKGQLLFRMPGRPNETSSITPGDKPNQLANKKLLRDTYVVSASMMVERGS